MKAGGVSDDDACDKEGEEANGYENACKGMNVLDTGDDAVTDIVDVDDNKKVTNQAAEHESTGVSELKKADA